MQGVNGSVVGFKSVLQDAVKLRFMEASVKIAINSGRGDKLADTNYFEGDRFTVYGNT